MRLFGYYRSSASFRIRIVLNLKGLSWDYETVRLNRGEQKSDEFTALNPSGLVPVLETGNAAISQSAAIAEYLEEQHPDPPLLPVTALDRARIREMMAVIGCDIHPLQNLRVLTYLRDEFDAGDAAVTRWIHRWIGAGFNAYEALAERHGASGPYSFGRAPTLADAWLVPQVYNAGRFGLDLTPWPRIAAINEHCLEQPAFAKAVPERQPDAPA
ncbi:MAG: maleylacetoacetate isomerase [Woeseia sp.]